MLLEAAADDIPDGDKIRTAVKVCSIEYFVKFFNYAYLCRNLER